MLDALFAAFEPDAVIHLAAETHVDRSIDDPSPFIATNVEGTATLLRAARAYLAGRTCDRFRFLHISTDEVFGALGAEGRFDETTPYAPRSPYAASKAASDHLVRAWHHTYGLPALITNCSNNFGPYQFPEKLIPLMILKARAGAELPVYGAGANVRDWLHVDDHARGLRLALDTGRVGETYLLGGRNERTNLAVVETICDLLDGIVGPLPGGGSRRGLIRFVADRPGHDFRYAIDPAKAERDLGWRPRNEFAADMEATVRWYLDSEAWWKPIAAASYDGRRLGLG
tara:strand:- start:660 stop:1517 length:858 start_codon:yes stop_codon:yes gene_type:complete